MQHPNFIFRFRSKTREKLNLVSRDSLFESLNKSKRFPEEDCERAWFVLRSEDLSFFSVPFGQNGDIVAPGDYDGDGKFDITVFRPSQATWYIQRSTAGTLITQFGANGDRPIPNAFVP
jgi:hypothetical protein